MKPWPRSLYGRNALLIVVLVLASQIGTTLVLRQLLLGPRLEQIADGLARSVGAMRAALAALPPQQRAAFVDAFNQHATAGAPGLARAQSGAGGARLTWLERRFVRTVTARIAQQGVRVFWRREADGTLLLALALDGSDRWLLIPGGLPVRGYTGAWIGASAASALLAMIGALWFQRRLNQPLAGVVQAARTLAQGREPAPLPEDGPSEVATVSRCFNQLVGSLRQSDHERALMLAGISHDLRTPLTKLRLGVEILREQAEPELFASMTRSVQEMDTIVGQFVDFARGDVAQPMAPGDLNALAADVAAAFADHGRAVQLAPGTVPLVPMREQTLRRAMVNLVENAWRHGQPPVTLHTGADAATAWFEVIDSGDGIAPAQVEALKLPFRRAESARSGPAGAGLGLAIVDRIARTHGGHLDLSAPPAGGLCARVTLPRAEPD